MIPGDVRAIIPAAGRGKRFGAAGNKLFLPLAGRPVLAHTLRAFEDSRRVDAVILVLAPGDREALAGLLARYRFGKLRAVIDGGAERQDSVARGLELVDTGGIVLVHDGARPLVTPDLIDEAVAAAERWGAAVVGIPVKDTVKVVTDGWIRETPDRRGLFAAQTPQAFRADLLHRAFDWARSTGFLGTDEASLVERTGTRVRLVPGSPENVKITTAEDMLVAEEILGRRGSSAVSQGNTGGRVSVGFGFDVHPLVEGGRLVLGGVEIPHSHGLLGHSDADVAIHALADALLGAAGLGDVGRHFPDTDESLRGISSLTILKRVGEMLREAGWRVANADLTVVAQTPRLNPHFPEMRSRLAAALGVPESAVNLKATTSEGLGFPGRGEGMVAFAVAALASRADGGVVA